MPKRVLTRCTTIMSLRQMCADDGANTIAVLGSQTPSKVGLGAPEVLAPDAPVHRIAGTPVAKYAFARRLPIKQHMLRRTSSDDLIMVPSLDDAR